ncbi:MAG TPA: isoleucine--tRNA ligase [Patescibacteria group bacterium]|jgi:isoleucyl-tRNA synthetase|nr:isoleucine--tRNA ligase [Patescibacteria group bacterium]
MANELQNQPKSALSQIEEEIFALWQKEKTFEKSMARRKDGPTFSFYDGPPFANGLPHFGHSLASSIKDSMLRYKTMRGYNVPRRNGWDCHGLPVEYAIEKEFSVSGKKQILELGIDKFNAACRDSIFTYKGEWERLLKRMGRWSEYENYYATVDTNYTESVWWAISQINKKGLLYKGYRTTPYCPRCETPLSNFEVNDGYKDNIPDPSLFVKFKLTSEDAHLLGWTTTPWSLPGNAAIAVNPKEQYVYAELTDEAGQSETLILAKKRLEAVLKDEQSYKVLKEVSGKDLVGLQYQPLFKLDSVESEPNKANLYKVWAADFVSINDGTGVLHVAPAFGEDDLALGEANQIPVLNTIDASGKVKGGIGFDEAQGMFFKKADRYIIDHLTHMSAVFAAETIHHTYPFCWRCETPLLYYAISSWFIKVSSLRSQLVKTAEDINWVPGHIKAGRFGKWLEGARDWSISRNRYWGAPLPVWVNQDDPNDYLVIGSKQELVDLAGEGIKLDDLHRPFIDAITFKKDGKTYKRVEEVLDCWFESGCMSIAQQHYPFENQEAFKKTFPADFIIEGLDQTHLWFYVQHVVATILFDSPAFKNVIVNGMIMAADGQKLSKRLKNYPPVEEVFDNEGADTLRLFLLSSTQATQVADYMRFDREAMRDLNRNVLGTLQNSYRFFKMYADIDNWQPQSPLAEPKVSNVLDKWMLARLNQTVEEVTTQADRYMLAHAINPIFELIDDMSNWFIRRSRRRFWKSEDDSDKLLAYATLHYTLVRVCQLLAPWGPFLSDKIYRDLMAGESVHLSDWPKPSKVEASLLSDMKLARQAIAEGLRQRAEAKIKVRQPLARLQVPKLPDEYKEVIAEEVNVKLVEVGGKEVVLDTAISDELRLEGLMRDIIRLVQNARKQAGLNVEDRIELSITSDDALIQQAIKAHTDAIKHETLATEVVSGREFTYKQETKLDGKTIIIALQK